MSSKLGGQLKRYSKDELIDRLLKNTLSMQELKKDTDITINGLKEKINNLESEMKALRASSIERLTDAEMLKEVLKLRATGKSPVRIFEWINDTMGLDIELLEVRAICDSIGDLSEEMKGFFNDQKKLYFSNIKFSKETSLAEDVQTFEVMIESAKRALESMDYNMDSEEFEYGSYSNLQNHLSKLIKDKNTILKSITGESGNGSDGDDLDIGFVEEDSEELEEFTITDMGDE